MLDVDRGMTFRSSPRGIKVGMYKDDPGTFYYGTGEIASDDDAVAAGFDVAALRMEKEKRGRLNEMRKALDQEYEQKLRAVSSSPGPQARRETRRGAISSSTL